MPISFEYRNIRHFFGMYKTAGVRSREKKRKKKKLQDDACASLAGKSILNTGNVLLM